MLVDREVAKRHARVTFPDAHPTTQDLIFKLSVAEAAILDYVMRNEPGKTTAATWLDPASTPLNAQHAVLILMMTYVRFRGDDAGAVIYSQGQDPSMDFPPAVLGLLRRFTDPVMA